MRACECSVAATTSAAVSNRTLVAAVEHTKPGAPTKSIAAFKTFVGDREIASESRDVEEKLGPWVNNLVSGLVRR